MTESTQLGRFSEHPRRDASNSSVSVGLTSCSSIVTEEVQPQSGINSGKSAVVVWKNLLEGIPEGKFFRRPLRTFLIFSCF